MFLFVFCICILICRLICYGYFQIHIIYMDIWISILLYFIFELSFSYEPLLVPYKHQYYNKNVHRSTHHITITTSTTKQKKTHRTITTQQFTTPSTTTLKFTTPKLHRTQHRNAQNKNSNDTALGLARDARLLTYSRGFRVARYSRLSGRLPPLA